MDVLTRSQFPCGLVSVVWVMHEYVNEHLADDLEVMEKVLICTHAEFRGKINDLSGVVLHDECIFLLFRVFFVVRVLGAIIRSSTSKGSCIFLILIF